MTDTSKIATPVALIPESGILDIAGEKYMRDSKGRLTPMQLVRPQDQLQDEMVRKIATFAVDLSDQVARFRGHSMDDIGDFDALLSDEYGGHSRKSTKGNRVYMSYDGCLKVQVQVAESIEFGPELQVARDLVDECLVEWAADARVELRGIVEKTFNTDKKGEISRAAIYSLLRMEIEDDRWQRAMTAIRDAMRIVGSKQYMRVYRRDSADGAWKPVTIDLAKTAS